MKFEIWTDHKNLEYFIKAQKFLVARSNKGGEVVCGRMRLLSEEQKSHGTAGGQADAKLNSRETLNTHIGRFHY